LAHGFLLRAFGARVRARASHTRAAAFALALLAAIASDARAAAPASLDAIVAGLARELPAEAARTLPKIRGANRRLLAVRSYLKAGPDLAARWSWSRARIRAYERSDAFRAAGDEIAKVTAAFEAANPGFTLYVNREVRSLDAQIRKWNASVSVGATAAELAAAVRAELATLPAEAKPAEQIERTRAFLLDWFSEEFPPALAAPGLSLHGQGLAFDFQVQRGDRIVAAASTASRERDWYAAGWAEKLRTAITSASARFEGPLAMPDEPWHYTYLPTQPTSTETK